MLQCLTIENYALIEHLEFSPTRGLTVITGETGAGKSIIMGALGLILGQRADAKTVRTQATKCVIEASFDISNYQLEEFFASNELEYDASNIIVRREIYATGKSRAFVNDTPVQLSLLKQLGEALIDIHSQHQNLLIGKESFQQEVLDALAGNSTIAEQYQSDYKKLSTLRKKLHEAKEMALKNAQEADYIRYQFEQLDEANLEPGELEELEEEQEMLSHAEDIKSSMYEMSELLNGEENSILSALKSVNKTAESLLRVYPSLQEITERIESDYIDLKDIAEDISSQAEDISFDPKRLEFVEDRISTLCNLLKKHGCSSVEELISLRDDLADRIIHIDNSDEEIFELEKELKIQEKNIAKSAKALSDSRKNSAGMLEKKLIEKVSYLGMPNVRFEVQIKPLDDYTAHGSDEILFLFSANKNQSLKPCGEVASGGEISRLMLSIKSLVASAKTLPTIIFDEIDTGVSGDIADRMGVVMKEMSDHLQVITITHLPQVAGKGAAHFMVYKEDSENDTTTHINQLVGEERVKEIARMLSGSTITQEALANAKTLMK
ncbi:MAG: DNA repair protein RecN [Bacteroidales bacterium]|nr:DNA repair protein RecN [Bacteroidales bacterium]